MKSPPTSISPRRLQSAFQLILYKITMDTTLPNVRMHLLTSWRDLHVACLAPAALIPSDIEDLEEANSPDDNSTQD